MPDFILSDHARLRLKRRGIDETMVKEVIDRHIAGFDTKEPRIVIQDRVTLTDPDGEYLLRIVVDIDREPAEIVTVYFTSKIKKYGG